MHHVNNVKLFVSSPHSCESTATKRKTSDVKMSTKIALEEDSDETTFDEEDKYIIDDVSESELKLYKSSGHGGDLF